MLIAEKNKSINFNVIDYEFPHVKLSKKEFKFDANWLRLTIDYCDENVNRTYTDTGLLTYELSDLVNTLKRIIDGRENSYISDFMEPYLSICITRIDKFIIFVFSFVYDTTDGKWSKIGVTAKWNMEEAKDKLKELKDMALKFPKR